jgi:peptidoglycan/xylan/chitin deacetylase (PgdA/CDA1 family)
MKKFLFDVLRYTGVPELLRETVQKKKVSILTFHDPEPGTFEHTARYLTGNYNVIPLSRYIKSIEDKEPLPPKSIIITMDDGHKNNYKLLPIIEKYKVPVTIFLCSGIVDTNRQFWWKRNMNGHSIHEIKELTEVKRRNLFRSYGFDYLADYGCENRHALNMAEIREMFRTGYVDFQSHTVYHVLLDKCDDEMSLEEIKNSRTDIQQKLNKPVEAIAYPNGNFSEREIKYVKHSGYKCALTTIPGYNSPSTNEFKLLRFGVRDNAGLNEIVVRSSGMWGFLKLFDRALQPRKTD